MSEVDRFAHSGNDAQTLYIVGKDLCSRRKWRLGLASLRAAAECGHVEAALELGMSYVELDDHSSAIRWFAVAAEADNIEAAFRLGLSLAAEQDLNSAIHWWRKAAQFGHERSASYLRALGNLECEG